MFNIQQKNLLAKHLIPGARLRRLVSSCLFSLKQTGIYFSPSVKESALTRIPIAELRTYVKYRLDNRLFTLMFTLQLR